MDGVGRYLVPRLRLVQAIIGVSHGVKGGTDRNQSIGVSILLNARYRRHLIVPQLGQKIATLPPGEAMGLMLEDS
jgi:hypothetical protein